MTRAAGSTLRFDGYSLGAGVDLLYRGDDIVPLEPRAARVLRYLLEHSDRVVAKEELLEEVWPGVFTTDGVLKRAVSQIRRALHDDADRSRFIVTYHGRGYRFVGAVACSAPADERPERDDEVIALRTELRGALEAIADLGRVVEQLRSGMTPIELTAARQSRRTAWRRRTRLHP